MLHAIRENWRDVRAFGWGVLARHLGRLKRDGLGESRLKGVGKVAIRTGQSDMFCIRQVFRHHGYDLSYLIAVQARINAAYDKIISNNAVPVIIDGGANIGAASLWFRQRYPTAKIVAVEPDDENYAVLQKNVVSHSNILPVQAALGGKSGNVSVENHGLGWAVQTMRSETGLPILTIEDCVKKIPNGEIFIVKIDIEGFESDVFSTNTEWIDKVQVILIEPHDWMLPGQFTSRTFLKALAPKRFEIFIVGENLAFVR